MENAVFQIAASLIRRIVIASLAQLGEANF